MNILKIIQSAESTHKTESGENLYTIDQILSSFKSINSKKRLTDIEKQNLINDYSNGMTMKEIGIKYKVTNVTTWKICKGIVKKQLTKKQAIEIIIAYKKGEYSQKELAAIYGVGSTTISAIITGQNFKALIGGESSKYKKTDIKVTF